jgi:hypothetical protein
MDTSYFKLIDGARIQNRLGLRMDEGYEYVKGRNYLYIEVPALPLAEEIKRNQHVFIEAAATYNVKGSSFFEVEPNPALAEYGQVQGLYRIHPESGEQRLGIWFTAHKSVDVAQLEYLVRIYMPA